MINRLKLRQVLFISFTIVCYGTGLSLLLFSGQIYASIYLSDQRIIHFNNLDAEQILSHPVVNDVTQDSQGFIWIATQDGLNRYDGLTSRQYSNIPGDPSSLSNNWIWDLYSDQEGRLWIASDSGISLYLPEKNGFKVFKQGKQYPGLLGIKYRTIAESSDGMMWFGSQDTGLTGYNTKTNKFTALQANEQEPNSLSSNKIRAVLVDSKQRLWVATDGGGLNIKLNDQDRFQQFSKKSKLSIPTDRIRSLYEDKQGKLWVGTYDQGVFIFDLELGVTKHFFNNDAENSLSSNFVRAIYQDQKQRIWLATDNGLNYFQPSLQQFIAHRVDKIRRSSLLDNRVLSIFQDQGGVIWIGTFGGVSRWNGNLEPFSHITQQRGGLGKALSSNVITSFSSDSIGQLYVGTWGGGVNLITPASGEVTTIRADKNNAKTLQDDRVMSLLVDSADNLWIGTRRGGLHKRAKEQMNFEIFQYDKNDHNSISSNAISKIIEMKNGTIVIATYGGGVNIMTTSNRFLRLLNDPSSEQSLSSNRVLDIVEGENGNLWIATHGGGLNRYLSQQGIVERFQTEKNNLHSLMSNDIFSLLNTDKYLWLATKEAGIARLSKQQLSRGKVQFEHFTRHQGLPSNVAYGLTEDHQGYIWISHSRGISRLQPDQLSFNNFNTTHGLQGSDFNSGAYYQDVSGRMFFGGANGFNTFMPENVPLNSNKPRLALTKFSRLGQEVPLHQMLRADGVLELDYFESMIGFEFAALDYTEPTRNRYQYKMEGLNDDWVDASNNNKITFSNLPDGHYIFRVRGTNNDGVWSLDDLEIALHVMPPIWRSWYAYTIYLWLFLAIAYWIYYRQKQKNIQHIAYRKKLEFEVEQRTLELQTVNDKLAIAVVETEKNRDKAEQAARAKSDFLATMSHEIRTPMNSVLGMTELLLNTELTHIQRRYASSAYSSGELMLDLINNVLDFSKMEANKVELENNEVELYFLIEESTFLFAGAAHEKNIELTHSIDINCPQFIFGDGLRIRQILTNLISNAIKFTESGHVNIRVTVAEHDLLIKVFDTGIGMTERQSKGIFTAFQQADSSTTRRFGGTGLGLSITKVLTDLMDGCISVDSAFGQGSTFTVTLPLQPVAVMANDNSWYEVAPIQVNVIAIDPFVTAMTASVLQRLNLPFTCIETIAQLGSGNAENLNNIYVVDASLLNVEQWRTALAAVANEVILMISAIRDNSYYNFPDADYVCKPLKSAMLCELILQKLADKSQASVAQQAAELSIEHTFNANILLVDDSTTNQEVAIAMLDLFGCDVDVADNGKIAVNKIKNQHYDLVFMDCQMPVMDGFDATRVIRQWQLQTNHANIPIIALTAGVTSDEKGACLECGMDDYLVKPFTLKSMTQMLARHLSGLTGAPNKHPVIIANSAGHDLINIDNELIDGDAISDIKAIEINTGRNIYSRVLGAFQQEMALKIPLLVRYFEQQDALSLASTAHAMKSLSANVGAKKLRELCLEIEQASQGSDFELCKKNVFYFELCYQETIDILNRMSGGGCNEE